MAKPLYVYTGSQWVPVASELESTSQYATTTYVDNKVGLDFITTQTFSAVSSVSINDVFSSTYDNYFITINHTGTTDQSLELRLRVSGSDNTTSNYDSVQIAGTGGTASSATSANQTSFVRLGNVWAGDASSSIYLFDPFNSKRTTFQASLNGYISSSAIVNKVTAGTFKATTSFTGFTILVGGGTVTGSLSVYGVKK